MSNIAKLEKWEADHRDAAESEFRKLVEAEADGKDIPIEKLLDVLNRAGRTKIDLQNGAQYLRQRRALRERASKVSDAESELSKVRSRRDKRRRDHEANQRKLEQADAPDVELESQLVQIIDDGNAAMNQLEQTCADPVLRVEIQRAEADFAAANKELAEVEHLVGMRVNGEKMLAKAEAQLDDDLKARFKKLAAEMFAHADDGDAKLPAAKQKVEDARSARAAALEKRLAA